MIIYLIQEIFRNQCEQFLIQILSNIIYVAKYLPQNQQFDSSLTEILKIKIISLRNFQKYLFILL